ncbi:oxidoreductase [Clostridia bacterium]|nr:oxidoreductase [Clostridia bacterium]
MLHVAIVGTGNIANLHSVGINAFPERAEVVALCDIYPDKAERLKEKFSFDKARIFDSHEKMLSSGVKIDIVHVCTPPSAHAEIAINSMKAGCNVLVEKPMAPSLAECDEMLAAEKANGVTMACIAQNRFRNDNYKLKKVADSGVAGKPLIVHVDSYWYRGHSYYDLWWRGTWEKEGGGPTLNHAVHQIDMLNWLLGELPTEVTAMLGNVAHDNSEVEDISFSALKYASGAVAQVTGSVCHHGEGQSLTLQCEKAMIAAPWEVVAENTNPNGGFPFPERNTELQDELTSLHGKIPDLLYEGHTAEIDDVYSALENGTKPLITGTDGKRTVELITAIYKSGFLKKTVSLPIDKDDEYYTTEGVLKNAIHFYKKSASVENFAPIDITTGGYKR